MVPKWYRGRYSRKNGLYCTTFLSFFDKSTPSRSDLGEGLFLFLENFLSTTLGVSIAEITTHLDIQFWHLKMLPSFFSLIASHPDITFFLVPATERGNPARCLVTKYPSGATSCNRSATITVKSRLIFI